MIEQDVLVRRLFPSEDGNEEQYRHFVGSVLELLQGFDNLKDASGVNLKGDKSRGANFYRDLAESSRIPREGGPLSEVTGELLELMKGHPYHTRYFITNILPMASIPGILGTLAAMLANGNNLWDVYGPAGAEAEVRVVAMMSELVGYDPLTSGGYTTWGGQGAVFSSLRLAITRFAPDAQRKGVPGNFYALCSEAAHYSLLKSVEAAGMGSDKLVRVATLKDSSMDLDDLRRKLQAIYEKKGIPIHIVGTTGTTDAFGIDDLEGISRVSQEVALAYGHERPHLHADSALGGFFAFFNDYDMKGNPYGFSDAVLRDLEPIRRKMQMLSLADSLCFDFQKLGQAPYLASLFLVKDAKSLARLDMDPEDTPYVGHRGYGDYHTGYTLECSRMASSITILSSLLAFGREGYCRLLAQFVEVNGAFRERLLREISGMEIVNSDNPGLVTLFRLYSEGAAGFEKECAGACSAAEIERSNALNNALFEILGANRDQIFFGDTKKHLLVPTTEGHSMALYAAKAFIISPYTQAGHVPGIVAYLKKAADEANSRFASGELCRVQA